YLLDVMDMEKVSADVKKARQAGDMVVAFLHIGTEYADRPSQEVKDDLQLLLDGGVDIAIGYQPHILRSFAALRDDQGNEMLVYYSLGKFISTQKQPQCMLGGTADITITKDPNSQELTITQADLVPLVTHYNHEKEAYAVYPLAEYTDELAEGHGIDEGTWDAFSMDTVTR